MAFWDDIGNYIGEVTGWNAAGRQKQQDALTAQAAEQDRKAREAQMKAQEKLMGWQSTTEGREAQNKASQEMAQRQAQFAEAQAAGEAQRAAQMAQQNAQRAGRTAGLNPAQAAMLAQDQTTQAYNQQLTAAKAQAAQNFAGQQGVVLNQGAQNLQAQGQNLAALQGAAGIGSTGTGYSNTDAMKGFQGVVGTVGGVAGNLAGGGAGAAGSMAAAPGATPAAPARPSDGPSDENLKEGIEETPASEALEGVRSVSFNYTPDSGEDPEPTRVGVIAQDLEKTPLAYTVKETPKGKVVDTSQLTLANTAMLSDLARKLDRAMAYYKEMI